MADEFEIFRNEFRPVHGATLENKIACPHPVCEEAVFLQELDSSNIIGFVIQK